MNRKIKVTGEPKDDIATEDLSVVYWLQAKRLRRERREREAKARARRQRRELEGRS
jgi:hypothetical protein